MLKHLLLVLFLVPLFSCSSYRYINTFDSDNVEKKSRAFQYEDDNLIVSYDLSNAELTFSIYNKSDRPIFLNWDLSNFILNGYSYDYFLESADFLSASSIVHNGVQAAKVTFSILSKEKPVNQIPPRSRIAVAKFSIGVILFDNEESFVREELRKKGFYEQVFDKETTPLNFRNFLTYSFDIDGQNHLYVDNAFWLSHAEFLKNKAYANRYQRHYRYDKYIIESQETSLALSLMIFIPISLIVILGASL